MLDKVKNKQPDGLQTKTLTIQLVAEILQKKNLISEKVYTELLLDGDLIKKRLQKNLDSNTGGRASKIRDMVSPTEVILSLTPELPGTEGKPLTEDRITEAIAEYVNMPYKKIDPLVLNLQIVTRYIPRPFALKHLIVPIEDSLGSVTMAVADPFDMDGVNSIKQMKKIKTNIVLSSKTDILKIVREFFGFQASIVAAHAEMKPSTELGTLEQFVSMRGQTEIDATDSHVINAVEYLLLYAFDQRASDIHIEPRRDESIVRLRIDGVLHNTYSMKKPVHAPVISRIKMLSRMDIAEKRRPQDGRIKTKYKGKELELRVSTLPVVFGEKVVIRIFDPDVLLQPIENLGFYPREFKLFSSFIRKPHGIILLTGPTGSGKTTTLYSALKEISTPELNIVTIEDPVEMIVEDFSQVGVQSAIGVTFANMLRTILRQDPDIIMVGEIRDKETADNAIQSALTGHLVLSTLHTNDSPTAITRLMDLGVPPFLIASTIVGIAAQRLVRKICTNCVQERLMSDEEMEYLQLEKKQYTIKYGEGCVECRGTGYKGRTAIYEIIECTDRIKDILSGTVELKDIYAAARADGMIGLREVAIKKLLDGTTTYDEVIFMTG
ncbi:MAG: type II/IV secretion system protein [Nitrospirae bacterium]|nr:type II/IV secretion system protein [Nitrospirota bacterium]